VSVKALPMRRPRTPPPRTPKKPKDVLFVHNNFPGQFGDLALAMQKVGYRVAAIAAGKAPGVPGVPMARWGHKKGTTEGIFRAAIRAEADLIRARAAADSAMALKKQGFDPKVIVGHPGWGETVGLKLIFPNAKQVLFGEFYYHGVGSDIDFDTEFDPPDFDRSFIGYSKNATLAMAYCEAEVIVCPTRYQASTLPEALQHRVRVIHEGVDTGRASPDLSATLALPDGRVLDRSVPVFTHVNRHLEPLRGLHSFLRGLPKALGELPEAQAIIIGNESASGYGGKAPDGRTWKQYFWDEVRGQLDESRVHFLGRTTHEQMISAMRISAAHVYYTYPFVLSWSLLEAMSCECLVLASDTEPVRDAIQDGVNGRLLDFFDRAALGEALIDAWRNKDAYAEVRKAARRTVVENFDQATIGRPQWLDLVVGMAKG
jgi:glycosyltransferase involved in cell wall biosynthesis